ncbi:hypothetical protein [Clostridium sardiniense]|uniref:hypothetical protein n=1 Tax=Clostridium sardiniense TaxID=29369 RepID=UPI00195B8590|nr:hypothetical protein [Clostridium sardiniense]MBM7835738.1 hypothetical protein [Clostridium sardiniense]
MKRLDYYKTSPNSIKINSGKIIFKKQLSGTEGEDIKINNSNDTVRALIRNTLNPMTESKEERSIQVEMGIPIKRGDYIEYKDNGEEVVYIVLSRVDNHKVYLKTKIRYCNQTLMCEGQPYPIPCVADNTTYGTKGVKDNNYFEERDARLKIWVQKNQWTDRYKENMRFVFNHRTCYEITKIDDTVLDGIYVMECILDSITSLDNLKDNIAYNKNLLKSVDDNAERPSDDTTEPNIILNTDKCKVGEIIDISITPINATLQTDDYGKLTLISPGKYSFAGVKSGDYATLQLVKEDKLLKEEYILIY